MSVNNYLNIPVGDDSTSYKTVLFHWGFTWETVYHIGEKLDWTPYPRPPEANGEIKIPGYYVYPHSDNLDYVLIIFSDDIIAGIRPSCETEYDETSEKTEAVMDAVRANLYK